MNPSTYTGLVVEHTGTFVAVVKAEFAPAYRKFTVASELGAVHYNMERTVHRADLVLTAFDVHCVEHVLGVEVCVTGDFPEFVAGDGRCVDYFVAASFVLFVKGLFYLATDDAALGHPENEAGANVLALSEQVEFFV